MPQYKPISKKRSKREWVIVDENKENQPTIGQVATKRACFTDIVCYESNNKGKSQAGERNITLWVKYTKGEMNLKLEPEHFINRSKGSSISPEKVRSLQSKKEEIRVMIEEPKASKPKELETIFALMKKYSKLQGESRKENSTWSFRIKCINKLLPTLTRQQIHNSGLYQDVQCRKCKKEKESFEYLSTCLHDKEAWAKMEEEILDTEEKIDLGSNWLREVFIPRDKEEYRNRHIEWSRGFLADNIEILSIAKEEVYAWIEQGVHVC
ncbi:32047_t:CDS:2 [Gigaspora margarita]|uniref:32047_t:CDS:1 n=1 Tax=Gigaspora margarita TaxID=4874 RepID=A0ABN7UDS0_GIGMA|nr:32047_t:CDS:2 [Gigaspora margarita]